MANFHDVHKTWFTDYSQQLVTLDLSDNNLRRVPKEVMNLPMIRRINLSSNHLYELPNVDNVDESRFVVAFYFLNLAYFLNFSMFKL